MFPQSQEPLYVGAESPEVQGRCPASSPGSAVKGLCVLGWVTVSSQVRTVLISKIESVGK